MRTLRIAHVLGTALFTGVFSSFSLSSWALEYRSVAENNTAMYDAPSQKAKPIYTISRGTPVEVVVTLEGWVKVRDLSGDIAWIEKRSLAEKRTVIVTARNADIRAQADASAPLVFDAEKEVVLDLVEPAPTPTTAGWAKVRHRDGQQGFVRVGQVWGL